MNGTLWSRIWISNTKTRQFEWNKTRYTVHGRGAKHWFTPSQILKSTPNRAPQILQFLNFFHPRNPRQKPLFKVSKKFAKSWSKLVQNRILTSSNPQGYVHFEHFFSKNFKTVQNLKNRSFKTPRSSGTWPPLHFLLGKSNYFPDERTDKHSSFDCAHGRKERFAQKGFAICRQWKCER